MFTWWCLHIWFSLWGWKWRCDGALLVRLNLQWHTSSHGLVGPPFIFHQDYKSKHTSLQSKDCLTMKPCDAVLHQMTWPLQSLGLNQQEWFGRSWPQLVDKAANKCSVRVGTHKAFQVTTSWSWLRECQYFAKLSSRQAEAYFEESKIRTFFCFYWLCNSICVIS